MKIIFTLSFLFIMNFFTLAQYITYSPAQATSGSSISINIINSPCFFEPANHNVGVFFGTWSGTYPNQIFTSYWNTTISAPITYSYNCSFTVTAPTNIQCNTVIKIVRNCTSTGTSTIYSNTNLNTFMITSPNQFETICSGNALSDPLITSNLSTGVTYSWSAVSNSNITGESTTTQNNNTINNILINNTNTDQTVIYNITATRSSPSCAVTSQKAVVVKPSTPQTPSIIVSSGNASFCQGSTVTLGMSGAITSNQSPSGWYNGSIYLGNNSNLTINNTGTYTFVNNNGCGTSASNSINTVLNLNPSLTSPNNFEICSGDNTNYILTANELCNYTWIAASPNITGETTSGIGNTINDILTNTTNTNQSITYQVSLVSQTTGCSKNQNVIVQVKPTPIVNSVSNSTICSGSALNIPLTSNFTGATFNWLAQVNPNISGETSLMSNSSNVTDTLINNATSNMIVSYDVNAITACGTSPTVNFSITVRPTPQPIIVVNGSIEFCEGGSVLLSSNQSYNSYNWSNGYNSSSVLIDQTNDISLTVTDANGCTGASSIIQIIEFPIPTPMISFTGGAMGSNYPTGNQWNFNGQQILGANDSTYSPTTNGSYSLSVTQNGCSATSNNVYIANAALEEETTISFSIYPNPTSNIVTITLQNNQQNNVLNIFNTIGQLVFEEKLVSNGIEYFTYSLEHLKPGVYLMKIGSITQKLILE